MRVLVRARPRSTRSRARPGCGQHTEQRVGNLSRLPRIHVHGGIAADLRQRPRPARHTTGHPRAMASSGANPKPSYNDGHTSTDARSSSAIFSASLTGPRTVTRPSDP